MHEVLLLMGFVPTVRIVKVRRLGTWDCMQVCLDTVDGLGTFVEMERMVAESEPADVQAAMDRRARELRVPLRRVTQTYDSLLGTNTGRPAGGPADQYRLPRLWVDRGKRIHGGRTRQAERTGRGRVQTSRSRSAHRPPRTPRTRHPQERLGTIPNTLVIGSQPPHASSTASIVPAKSLPSTVG